MALGGRAVVELDDVRAVLPGRRPRSERPDTGPDRHAVAPRASRAGPRSCADGRSARGAARTGRSSSGRRTGRRPGPARSRSGRHRGRPGCVAARGPASPRSLVQVTISSSPSIGRPLRDRADGDDDVRAGELVGHVVVTDGDPATTRDRAAPAIDDGPRLGQRRRRGVVSSGSGASAGRLIMKSRCAEARGQSYGGRVRVMPRSVREERLRRQAADVRAAAAEPAPIDDGHRRAEVARLVGRGLARRSRADDDEVVRVHDHSFRAGSGRPRWRRAS